MGNGVIVNINGGAEFYNRRIESPPVTRRWGDLLCRYAETRFLVQVVDANSCHSRW